MQGQWASASDQLLAWPVCWAEACSLQADDDGAASAPSDLDWLLPMLPASNSGLSLTHEEEQVLATTLQHQMLQHAQHTVSAATAATENPASGSNAAIHAPNKQLARIVSRAAAVALNDSFAGEPARACDSSTKTQIYLRTFPRFEEVDLPTELKQDLCVAGISMEEALSALHLRHAALRFCLRMGGTLTVAELASQLTDGEPDLLLSTGSMSAICQTADKSHPAGATPRSQLVRRNREQSAFAVQVCH